MTTVAFGFLMFFYAAGLAVNFAFFRRLDPWFLCFSAVFSGALLWVLVAASLFALSAVVTANPGLFTPTATAVVCGLLVAMLWAWVLTRRPTRSEAGAMAITGVFVALCAAVAVLFDFSIYTFDSYDFHRISRAMADPRFHEYFSGFLVTYPFLLPSLTFMTGLIGAEHAYFIPAFFSYAFVGVFVYSNVSVANRNGYRPLGVAIALAASAALFSTYFVLFNFFYMNSHMLAAAYIYLFVYAGWSALQTRDETWLCFAGVLLTGYLFTRLEAPLMVAVFTFLLATLSVGRVRGTHWLLLPLIAGLLWCLVLWQVVGGASGFLSGSRFLIISGIIAVTIVVVSATRVRRLEHLLALLPALGLLILPLVMSVFFLMKPEHMVASAQAMLTNFLEAGLWGGFPFVVLVLAVLLIATKGAANERIFFLSIMFYLGALLAFVFLRDQPYRLGFGDSANRMLLHIAPVIILWTTLRATSSARFLGLGWRRPKSADAGPKITS